MKAYQDNVKSTKRTSFMSFDLQPTMPFPKLSTSVTFIYNKFGFTISECMAQKKDSKVEENGVELICAENEGAWGADETVLFECFHL